MKEVASNIFAIHLDIGFRNFKFPVNVYVLAGKDGIVFDSGYATKKARNKLALKIGNISKLMKDRGVACSIKSALSSHGHWDHFSGLYHLQKNLGLNILATQKQANRISSEKAYFDSFHKGDERLDFCVGKYFGFVNKLRYVVLNKMHLLLCRVRFVYKQIKIINEDAKLSINGEIWQVIYLPGHCDDDIVLYNKERGILLAGDIVLRSITTWLGPPKSNLSQYIKSLEYILNLPNLKLILPAHGSPIDNPYERVQEAIDHRKKRTRELFELLLQTGEKGLSLKQIFKIFYPHLTVFQKPVLCGWILVTLEYLVERKKILSVRGKRNLIFKAIEENRDLK